MTEGSLQSGGSTIVRCGRMDRDDSVELDLPARPEFIGLTRLIVSGLAAQAEFSVDEIEDVRIAVDEMCATLIEQCPDGSRLTVTFTLAGPTLRCRAVATAGPTTVEFDELATLVLAATVDQHSLVRDGAFVAASMEKTRSASMA